MSYANNKISIKIVILGEPGVGKTSIYNRYTSDKFNAYLNPTSGASYNNKEVLIKNPVNI